MSHSSIVGGSTAGRLIQCPGSRKLVERVPEHGVVSEHAQRGTALHKCMERIITTGASPHHFIGETIEGVPITEELVNCQLFPAYHAMRGMEEKLDIDTDTVISELLVTYESLPGVFGSADYVARTHDGEIVVLDFKFGTGVLVNPIENPQLMFYAAGLAETPETAEWWPEKGKTPVTLVVIQPAQSERAVMWETSTDELDFFFDMLSGAIKASEEPEPRIKRGDHCRWCPAKPICPAHKARVAKALTMNPEDTEALAVAMGLVEDVEAWARAVKARAHAELEHGNKIRGFKLVQKRASRVYTDENLVLRRLKLNRKLKQADYMVSKLCSPPQLEKVCKQKGMNFDLFTDLVDSVSSGTTLARADDPRPAVEAKPVSNRPKHLQNV